MKNLDSKCVMTMSDEQHYMEYGCEYGDNSCGFDHDDMVNEIYDFVRCESCKVKDADEKFMNNLAKGE